MNKITIERKERLTRCRHNDVFVALASRRFRRRRQRRRRSRFLHAAFLVQFLGPQVLSNPDADPRVVEAEGQQRDDEAGQGEPRHVDLRPAAW